MDYFENNDKMLVDFKNWNLKRTFHVFVLFCISYLFEKNKKIATHYENTPIQIYRIFTSKNWKFSDKT